MQIVGGLGNQMFQYALGKRLALDKNVPLKLDLSWYEEHPERPYRLNQFKIHASQASHQEIIDLTRLQTTDIYSRIYRFYQRRLPYYYRNVIIEEKTGYDSNILQVPINAYLSGYWQNPRYFETIQSVLMEEFEPIENVEETPICHLLDKMKNSNSISLHIRRGDYVKDERNLSFHGTCSISYYERAVAYLLEHFENLRVYVFSDEIEWAKQNLELSCPTEFISGQYSIPDYIEMQLMKACTHHIVANSSFSWWAAWLCKNTDKVVIAPQKWFTGIDLEDIVCSEWIRL